MAVSNLVKSGERGSPVDTERGSELFRRLADAPWDWDDAAWPRVERALGFRREGETPEHVTYAWDLAYPVTWFPRSARGPWLAIFLLERSLSIHATEDDVQAAVREFDDLYSGYGATAERLLGPPTDRYDYETSDELRPVDRSVTWDRAGSRIHIWLGYGADELPYNIRVIVEPTK